MCARRPPSHARRAGFVVVRDAGPAAPEVRRQRVFEKALDAAATSPFARLAPRWVLAGLGAGARVAAVVGARARSSVVAQVLVAYPLAAPMPTIKGSQMPDSCMPLLRVSVPTLLVAGDADAACPVAALRTAVRAMASPDVRLVVAQGVDGSLSAPGAEPPGPVSAPLAAALAAAVLEFVAAAAAGRLDTCGLQRAKGPDDGPPAGGGLAALQAAHVRMQEEDALAYQQGPSGLLPAEGEEAVAGPAAVPPPSGGGGAAVGHTSGSGGGAAEGATADAQRREQEAPAGGAAQQSEAGQAAAEGDAMAE
ncbi:hypothetical protein MNEG_10759 [Monoraphidium neglectum]|uniref:KANL3/Tex30 alpha/beta hydrolase-like domain-containing protein n=1 Tax=Monoraphidium neglectum TaxID=145388 RepID=A0A0D2JBX7_9CHLO|nr:hypothetical protein MNEG_10759 [Monoraphidium neglectum]KIY97202.1 hypothetical protein MNEG_10759 [Monoraphidium neglectum]|eukprot:XP_013896222.1 hypothetical protein MNEG_10759 [Monoraphidium neglectum]